MRPTGQSCIVFVPQKGKSYLRNCRYIKPNPVFEYEDKDQILREVNMTYSKLDLQAMQVSII